MCVVIGVKHEALNEFSLPALPLEQSQDVRVIGKNIYKNKLFEEVPAVDFYYFPVLKSKD